MFTDNLKHLPPQTPNSTAHWQQHHHCTLQTTNDGGMKQSTQTRRTSPTAILGILVLSRRRRRSANKRQGIAVPHRIAGDDRMGITSGEACFLSFEVWLHPKDNKSTCPRLYPCSAPLCTVSHGNLAAFHSLTQYSLLR